MCFAERSSLVRIIIEMLSHRPGLRRWAWFVAIYGSSVLVFGAVTGILSLCLPK
jgi:hypothetical protein